MANVRLFSIALTALRYGTPRCWASWVRSTHDDPEAAEDEALRAASTIALTLWPRHLGWSAHAVSAHEVPPDWRDVRPNDRVVEEATCRVVPDDRTHVLVSYGNA